MEAWQKTYIDSKLPELVEITRCTVIVYGELRSRKLLAASDVEELQKHGTQRRENYAFYELIKSCKDAYKHLIQIFELESVRQTKVSEILRDGFKHAPETASANGANTTKKRSPNASHSGPYKKVCTETNASTPSPCSSSSQCQQQVSTSSHSTAGPAPIIARATAADDDDEEYTNRIAQQYLAEVKKGGPLTVSFESPTNEMIAFLKSKNSKAYKLPFKNKGLALIINIKNFPTANDIRKGSEYDVTYMREIWRRLGYQIFKEKEIDEKHGTWGKEDLLSFMDMLQTECKDSEDPTSIVVFVGSHGGHNLIYTSECEEIRFEEITTKFYDGSCEGLKDKPKIFLFSACQNFSGQEAADDKGNPLPKTEVQDNTLSKAEEKDLPPLGSSVSDLLVCISQAPGFSSFRNEMRGTWFIHCLTFVMMKCAREKSIQKMLSITTTLLKTLESEECSVQFGYRQSPFICSGGMDKDLYFVFK